MKQLLDGLMGDAEFLLKGAVAVMAIWFVIWSWVRTKSIVPTVGALLLGGVVMWGVANIPVLRDEVGEDIDRARTSGRDSSLVTVDDGLPIDGWPVGPDGTDG